MRLLLDSHALIWWLEDNRKLSAVARKSIALSTSTVFVSAATIWELRIKQTLGKISLPGQFLKTIEDEFFELLPIRVEHADSVHTLPPIHKDPFDRMLVAQAKIEALSLVSANAYLAGYGVPIVW